MPKAKYEPIYRSIRNDILKGKYHFGDLLPSENSYAEAYSCTRNTVRRALGMLTAEGLVQPQHGRGVQVIFQPDRKGSLFTIGGIESFAETVRRNGKPVSTDVVTFRETVVDEKINLLTGFDVGTEIYYIERIRNIDHKAVIFDTNIYMKSEVPGLTKEIAQKSIYNYLENELHMVITTSRRTVYAEKARAKDRRYLDLGDLDFVLVVSGQVFNAQGIMFEFTQSRHRPDMVSFVQTAVRQKI